VKDKELLQSKEKCKKKSKQEMINP
jgi:hypothetical protein